MSATILSTAKLNCLSVALGALLGGLASFYIERVSPLDIIGLCWFLFCAIGNPRFIPKLFDASRARIGFVFFAAGGLFIADLVNATSAIDLLKGVGTYVILGTTTCFMYTLFSSNVLWFAVFFLALFQFVTSEAAISLSAESFKFGFGSILINLILLIFSFLPERGQSRNNLTQNLQIGLLLIAFSLWGNSRSTIFVALLALFFPVALKQGYGFLRFKISPFFVSIAIPITLILLSLLLTGGAILFLSTVSLFLQDLINPVLVDKTLGQMGGSLGLLFGGRSEIFSSLIAWQQSPVFGFGSYAKDPGDQFEVAGIMFMQAIGYGADSNGAETFERTLNLINAGLTYDLIGTHSFILTPMVWGGLLAVIPFYIFFSNYVCAFLLFAQNIRRAIPFYVWYAFFSSFWIILFSPPGYLNRTNVAFLLAFIVKYVIEWRSSCKSK